ncbi:hypothetical protein [Sediminibacterium sp. TEGAF015]|uniref:hypothetical protein n=1 Tax=Sediminibacterium sp. TEGAF015 TaxID=575378 RepID=UPI002207F4D4|nr:hypothetical protein [Sediminibacterium sp. TEGAF015]BDQ12359.1 hypothetical protein TEGAF0_15760 [Sediminibacterium sp. TEGAF015]
MKIAIKYFSSLVLATLFLSFGYSQVKVKIGNHIYTKRKVTYTIKDEFGLYLYSTCYQYYLNDKKYIITLHDYTKRNDTIFEKGDLKIDYKNRIIKQKDIQFFQKAQTIDSSIRIFKQKTDGSLILKRLSLYKNGVEIKRTDY